MALLERRKEEAWKTRKVTENAEKRRKFRVFQLDRNGGVSSAIHSRHPYDLSGGKRMNFDYEGSTFSYFVTRETSLCLLMLFIFFASSGCERNSKRASTQGEQKKVMGILEEEINDPVGSKELFEERRVLWLKNMPHHYRLKFVFTCACHLDTTQIQDGKVTMERSGNLLTIEVKDGKVIGIYKEDGEQAPVEECRTQGTPSGLIEYIWSMGKPEHNKYKLLSEPIGLLWYRGQEAIQSKPEKKITITYDKQFGFIKRIDFGSSIPDYYFRGEIKEFTPLN